LNFNLDNMKTRSMMKNVCLVCAAVLVMVACKKKDDAKPGPNAASDSYTMMSGTDTTVKVLSNDTYTGSAKVSVTDTSSLGHLTVNSDQTIKFTPTSTVYGTFTFKYTLTDDNGSSVGSITITRGTTAQIKTSGILDKYNNTNANPNPIYLFLYAVDGDTSYVYKQTYGGQFFDLENYNTMRLFSASIMPTVSANYNFTIGSDGTVSAFDSAHNPIFFTVLGTFSATAKSQNHLNTVNVSGFSIQYNGHKLDYTNAIH
jgi:hypothetical protein